MTIKTCLIALTGILTASTFTLAQASCDQTVQYQLYVFRPLYNFHSFIQP
ncbi:MAG: hypothetical protein GY821_07850 [Gammaproteobacteria bacterium]|nr:hypothetical protein [Gammaproteobacteria bacterium]